MKTNCENYELTLHSEYLGYTLKLFVQTEGGHPVDCYAFDHRKIGELVPEDWTDEYGNAGDGIHWDAPITYADHTEMDWRGKTIRDARELLAAWEREKALQAEDLDPGDDWKAEIRMTVRPWTPETVEGIVEWTDGEELDDVFAAVCAPPTEEEYPPLDGDMFVRVAALIEKEQDMYDQGNFYEAPEKGEFCDTPFCVAGWAAMEARGSDWSVDSPANDEIDRDQVRIAGEALQITADEADRLFANRWPAWWFRAAGCKERIEKRCEYDDGHLIPMYEEAVAVLEWIAKHDRVPPTEAPAGHGR